MLIGISFGLNWNVISGDDSILVYGYINENQGTNIDIQVKDMDGNIIWEGTPEFSSDYDTSTIMSGAFYEEINLVPGEYIVKVIVDGNSYSNEVVVNSQNLNLDLGIIDISQNEKDTTIRIFIENKNIGGNIEGSYTLYYRGGSYTKDISLQGRYEDTIVIPTDKFGKNTVTVLAFVPSSIDSSPIYTYQLFKNEEQTLPKDFEVETNDISIVRGGSGEFNFNVKNLDNYSINLNINYDSNLDVYGEQQITLQPNEKKEVSYYVSVPRDFNDTPYLKIDVSNGNYEKEKDVNVNILPFEGFNLSISLKQYLPGQEISTSAIVENIGDEKKDIQFSYEVFGEKYLFPYKVSLSPGESFSFPVTILIPNDQTTDFNVKFFINNEEFDKTIEVTPYVHEFSINLNESDVNVIAGNNKEISLLIENTGNIRDNYKILVNGWKYYTLNENKVSIGPGNKGEIKIDIVTNKDMKMGNHIFNVSVSNGYYTRYQDINLFIDKPENEQSNISFVGKDIQKFSANKTFNYTLKIKNIGIEEKEYLIKVSEFNITKDVYLSPNETKKVIISVVPKEAKDYNFSVTLFSNGVKIWNKGLELKYVEKKTKITGAFVLVPREASIIGLATLAILGGAVLGLYIGEKIKVRVNREKTVVSNDYR